MRTDGLMITVEQSLYRLSFQDRALHDLFTVFRLYMYILIIIWFDTHQRSQFTQTLTTCFDDSDMWNIFLHLHGDTVDIPTQDFHFFINFLSTGCDTAGTGTDKNATGIRFDFFIYLCLSV